MRQFLAAALMANDLVDRETVNAIRRQFRHIVRKALPEGEGAGADDVELPALTPTLVYEELRERGRVAPGVSYDAWQASEWLPRVREGTSMPLGSPIDVPRVQYVEGGGKSAPPEAASSA